MSQQVFWLWALPGVITFIGTILSWLSLQGLPRAGPYRISQRGNMGAQKWASVLTGTLVVSLIPVLNWVGVLQIIAYVTEGFQRHYTKARLHLDISDRLQATRDARFRQATEEDRARLAANERLFSMIQRDPNASCLEDQI